MDQIYSGKTSKRNKRKKKNRDWSVFYRDKETIRRKSNGKSVWTGKDRCGSDNNFSYDTPSDNSNVFESGQENSDHKRWDGRGNYRETDSYQNKKGRWYLLIDNPTERLYKKPDHRCIRQRWKILKRTPCGKK